MCFNHGIDILVLGEKKIFFFFTKVVPEFFLEIVYGLLLLPIGLMKILLAGMDVRFFFIFWKNDVDLKEIIKQK